MRRLNVVSTLTDLERPFEEISGFQVRPGNCMLSGATKLSGGVNFTIYSENATSCELLLFRRKSEVPYAIIRIPERYRTGGIYSIFVYHLNIEEFEYAYRFDGPNDPSRGLVFDRKRLVLDPYAKAVTGQRAWGAAKSSGAYHARVVRDSYVWRKADFPRTKMEDTIIYEMHVRGFTRHRSSGVRYPGTFAGIIEKIPHLKSLGVTAVELLPIFEFDETINTRTFNGKRLLDYWGYNTVAFFAPNTAYTASIEYNEEGNELFSFSRSRRSRSIWMSCSTTLRKEIKKDLLSLSREWTTASITCSHPEAIIITSAGAGIPSTATILP